MAFPDLVPGGLWTEGLASLGELCRAGGQPDLGCPVTDASQDWFYSVLVRPCPRRALSGLWRQLCSLGALPAGASSSGKPQRPLETASCGYTHAHTQAHSVCAHTHRHGADMTRDTCVFMDADTFRATRGPGFVERPGGQGAAPDVPQTGPFREACPQFSDEAARLRPGRGSHGSA